MRQVVQILVTLMLTIGPLCLIAALAGMLPTYSKDVPDVDAL